MRRAVSTVVMSAQRPVRRAVFLLVCLTVLVGGSAESLYAQGTSATINGQITDSQGRAVPGVEVQAVNIDTGAVYPGKTNSSGIYVIPGVPPGRYRLVVLKDGFKEINKTGLVLHVQDTLEQNFALVVGSISESVTVTGSGINVNTTDAAVSTVIDRQFVENMPLNGRSFQDLLTLAPGVALVGNAGNGGYTTPGGGGEITVNGQRTEANYFTVDGVSANTGTLPFGFGTGAGFGGGTPSETALGTTQTMVSVDALEEFRATTSTYSAEYGRTPGGQFSFTTRSGANDWHGSAFDYVRNEAFDANNYFNNLFAGLFPQDASLYGREKERQNDFGGTLGGPITIPHLYSGKDRTFFFFSYEGLRLWTPQGVENAKVPDAGLRNAAPSAVQPLLKAFPLPNGGDDGLNDGFGLYATALSFPSSIDSISLRVDHSFSEKFRVFGRYANTETSTATYAYAIKNSTVSNNRIATLGATTTVTARQSNELRFNITESDASSNQISTNLGGATPLDIRNFPGPGGGPMPLTGGYLQFCICFAGFSEEAVGRTQGAQRQYNLIDTYNWQRGRHDFKFGVDWRRLSTNLAPTVIGENVQFQSEASVLANIADSVQAYSFSQSTVEPVYKNFSTFARDEWKATDRLSVSLGLRWDVNPAPGNLTGPSPHTVDQITDLATTKLASAGTPLWRTDWRGFAPRVGMAYLVRPTQGRETVIRGGFGLFYDMGNAMGSSGFGGIGFGSSAQFSAVSFPLTSAQLTLPAPSVAPPYDNFIGAFDPHLKLPYTLQWNVAVEQALGRSNALTVSYVGSAGRRLLSTFEYAPEQLGNPNFSANVCAACLDITENRGTSDYDALQIQFERRLSRGLQALASYTWGHSTDDASSNFFLTQLLRSSSDFDIRNNFQAALTYDVPGTYSNHIASVVLEHWGLSTRISARSALPVNIIGAQELDPVTNTYLFYNPDVVPHQPLYLYGSQYAGGRVINYNAFQTAPAGVEGNAGRNSARGFGAWQTNLALRRDFPIHERLRLQFRAEAFNLFNHPSFSGITNNLSSGPCMTGSPFCFGAAGSMLNTTLGGLNPLYQVGGPRSLQIMLKLAF